MLYFLRIFATFKQSLLNLEILTWLSICILSSHFVYTMHSWQNLREIIFQFLHYRIRFDLTFTFKFNYGPDHLFTRLFLYCYGKIERYHAQISMAKLVLVSWYYRKIQLFNCTKHRHNRYLDHIKHRDNT